ncbi:hypothetical protein TNCV_2305602 [Trichonephila clavipes]|nr:hypothetical protein TNCV_2305602 [Trichonephila clavipes]
MELDIWQGDWTLPSVDLTCLQAYAKFSGAPVKIKKTNWPLSRYATKTDQFPYSLIHQSAVVESDQRLTFKSGILSAFKIEFTSRAPRGILKSLRGATLDFALTRITLTLESTIDRAKTHPAYDPLLASTNTCNSLENLFSDRSSKPGFCQLHHLFPWTSRRRKVIKCSRVRDPLESVSVFRFLSQAIRISSGKQDSTNGVRKSPYFSCVHPRLSNDRNFPSSSSYKVDKSVFVLPESVLHY